MYKEFVSVFKNNSLLENAFDRSYEMIDIPANVSWVRKRLRVDKGYIL